jgi:hypothetical protein
MKRLSMTTLAIAAALALPAGTAWADRGGHGRNGGGFHGGHEHHEFHHHHGAVFIGPTFFWPGYWGPFDDPFYSYPPGPSIAEAPPVYIERGDGNPPPATANQYWYYCEAANAYYPYVKQCPGGWKAVAPQQ